MAQPAIPPEGYVDLKIHLDRVTAAQSECVNALGGLAAGSLSRDEYLGLLNRQTEAQQAWLRRHDKYFGRGDA